MAASMITENVIKRSCVNLRMKGRNKREIIEEMADMPDWAGVLIFRNLFIRATHERKREGPTGIGNQAAIPHGKSDAVLKTAMVVGRVDQGVEWETLGEGDTRAFAMFAINSGDKSELISLLFQVVVAFYDDDAIEILLTTGNEEEIFTLLSRRGETQMKTVGIVTCTAGIAYTHMVREKLIERVKARGHECRVEAQGIIGTEYRLTEQEIAEADVVILAVDVKISGEERLKGKPVIRAGTAAVIKNAIELIERVEEAMENKG